MDFPGGDGDSLDNLDIPVDSASSVFPCYLRGTLILTERGEVAVEELVIGDRVKTLSGAFKPVKWIGTRTVDMRFVQAKDRDKALPVLIRQGALAENVPHQDLSVSPNHALYLDGNLFQARHLINGRTIVQRADLARFDYFHVELDEYDVMYANGAEAESYAEFVDENGSNRNIFANAASYRDLYPEDAVAQEDSRWNAPVVKSGAVLEAVRATLNRRADTIVPAVGAAA